MNRANKNHEANNICSLCIQPYEYPPPVMTLVGCEQSGRTAPPKAHQKLSPIMQDIALFLHSSTRTVSP